MSTALSETHPSKIQQTTASLRYLYNPTNSVAPPKRRTRVLLRSIRYILQFLYYRVLRSIKYAAIGAVTAAVAGTAIGTMTGGLGFVFAPTGILGGAGVGLLWGMGKMGWRVLASRVRRGDVYGDAKSEEREAAHGQGMVDKRRQRGADIDPW